MIRTVGWGRAVVATALVMAVVGVLVVSRPTDVSAEAPVGEVLAVRRPAPSDRPSSHVLVKRADAPVQAVAVPAGSRAEAVLRNLLGQPGVEYAELDATRTASVVPNDPYFGGTNGQWGLHNTGGNGRTVDADIDAPEAWDAAGLGGAGQWPAASYTVAVVDSGVQTNHPDLVGQLGPYCRQYSPVPGTLLDGCADENGHGTHVAGIVAAAANNGIGVTGVAPNARLAICRALDGEGVGFDADIAACIRDLVAKRVELNLKAINLSLGGPDYTVTLRSAIEAAENAGIVVVAAAGNAGSTTLEYPAGFAGVISVAATTTADTRANFSNTNSDVELAAPGSNVLSTYTGSAYAYANGTSMASPHVAAAAGLVAWKLGLNGADTRARLTATADDLGAAGRDTSFGFGRLNLCRALGCTSSSTTSSSTTTSSTTTSSTTTSSTTSTTLPGATTTTVAPTTTTTVAPTTTTTVAPTTTTTVAPTTTTTAPPAPPVPSGPQPSTGYRMVARDGGIFAFGSAGFFGSTGGMPVASPIVDMASTPTGRGYWFVAADGSVYAFGDAPFLGNGQGPAVGIAPTPSGRGYWVATTDGRVGAFGDAPAHGGVGGLAHPVVGLAVTPSGGGYWLVARDGGIFAFGNARFFGSTGNIRLNQPVVGMAASPTGGGYWLVATDGGIFAFGDARFFGSTGNIRLNKPVVGMHAEPSGDGYRMVASDGGIFAFGGARFYGSTGNITLNQPVVGID